MLSSITNQKGGLARQNTEGAVDCVFGVIILLIRTWHAAQTPRESH